MRGSVGTAHYGCRLWLGPLRIFRVFRGLTISHFFVFPFGCFVAFVVKNPGLH
jgi:hypothetical protein